MDGMKFLNLLYHESLVGRDFALYTRTDMDNPIKSGQAGEFTEEWGTIYRESRSILTNL
jgi:hypothetical protein